MLYLYNEPVYHETWWLCFNELQNTYTDHVHVFKYQPNGRIVQKNVLAVEILPGRGLDNA